MLFISNIVIDNIANSMECRKFLAASSAASPAEVAIKKKKKKKKL